MYCFPVLFSAKFLKKKSCSILQSVAFYTGNFVSAVRSQWEELHELHCVQCWSLTEEKSRAVFENQSVRSLRSHLQIFILFFLKFGRHWTYSWINRYISLLQLTQIYKYVIKKKKNKLGEAYVRNVFAIKLAEWIVPFDFLATLVQEKRS